MVSGVAWQAGNTAQAGVHVAADVDNVQVGAGRPQLCSAAGRPGADPGSGRQVGQLEPIAGAQDVADVHPARRGGKAESYGRTGGQVLERMDGDVALTAQQRVAQGRNKDARAAHLGQRPGEDVTVSADVHQFHRETPDGGELVRGLLGLGERQFAGAGSNPDRHGCAVSPASPEG